MLVKRIVAGLEELDGSAKFSEDIWKRDEGGGGITIKASTKTNKGFSILSDAEQKVHN